jgi:hypothetical protein
MTAIPTSQPTTEPGPWISATDLHCSIAYFSDAPGFQYKITGTGQNLSDTAFSSISIGVQLESPDKSEVLADEGVGQYMNAVIQPSMRFRIAATLDIYDANDLSSEYLTKRLPAALTFDVRWTTDSGFPIDSKWQSDFTTCPASEPDDTTSLPPKL